MERFGNSALHFLGFVSAAGWENVAEIFGKFGGADHFSLTDSAPSITEYDLLAEKSN
ncbi:MAG: hypothetical protein ACLPYZ_15610 [Limisphaerales bacterium]